MFNNFSDSPNISVDGGIENSAPFVLQREPVVFPHVLVAVNVEERGSLAALAEAMKHDRIVAVFNTIPNDNETESPDISGELPLLSDRGICCCRVGTLVRVVKEITMPDGTKKIVVRGLKRIDGTALNENSGGVLSVRYKIHQETGYDNSSSVLGKQKMLLRMFGELCLVQQGIPEEAQLALQNITSASRNVDQIADTLNFAYAEKLLILASYDLEERMDMLAVLLNRELESARLSLQLQAKVQEAMGASQKEFYLREQLKAIKQELGELSSNSDVVELTEKMGKVQLPDDVRGVLKKELERLELLPQNAPEYHISYNYISTMLSIPWKVFSKDRLDCKIAAEILDEDHFGLEDVKERILEFLAVMQRRIDQKDCRAPILCLVGPPGVGKTSIGKSIARAMDREFIRVSFGGVRDEAEIRGHRRTYVGAMPGRIVQNLKRAGTTNPVFMLDEIDKLAHDFRGDPASALLEVLDPEQNNSFNDNFVELPLDLSKVFFIATANVLEDIPGPLRDRMEVIRLSGYTALEKREIARRYLIPRQLKENGVDNASVSFSTSAVSEIIEGYTMEAGVRELDRVIARCCRRIAGKFVSGQLDEKTPVKVDGAMVKELLGAKKYLKELVRNPQPGCATGMAWTSVGGVVLPVETIALPGGKGNLKLTGSLGKVMLESAEAAFTFIRANAPDGVAPEFFTEHDFHIHVPDGATPKDGPSAGITMALALMSLLKKEALIPRLAMTGEITLQGKITAIGGVREKLVGAIRAGVKTVLVPKENEKDVQELPENVRKALEIHFVSNFKDAMRIAFK
ncbi:MAG: endopeptidase La [Lentisphaerae bacterium]|nr:endopeptidase La [Lentisphaerota bacterium]